MIANIQKSIKRSAVLYRMQCLECHKSGKWRQNLVDARLERNEHNEKNHSSK